MSAATVMAIPDLDREAAGAIVLWRLQGETDASKLEAALKEAGLEALMPSLPSAAVALRRALRAHESKHVLARALPNGGYAMVRESPRESAEQPLEYEVLLTVHVSSEGRLDFKHPFTVDTQTLVDSITEAAFENMLRLEASDTGSWLSRCVDVVKAVPLRDTGGVYFVPRETLPTWRKIVDALRGASHSYGSEIPALKSTDAIAAILDSLNREADAFLERVQEELSSAVQEKGGMGSRAVKTRLQRCEESMEKLAVYEKLLGVSLDSVRARVEGMQANLAAAVLVEFADQQIHPEI